MHLSGLTQTDIQWIHATNNTLTSLFLTGTSMNKNHQATQCLKEFEMIGYETCRDNKILTGSYINCQTRSCPEIF